MKRLVFLAIPMLALSLSCEIKTGLGAGASTGPGGQQQPPPPQPQPAADGSGGASVGGATPQATAECPNPENHCLDPNDFFASKQEWKKNYTYTSVATQQAPPDAAGEASFMLRKNGENMTTKWFYRTHPLTAEETQVGKLVMIFHRRDRDIYRGPTTRQEATSTNWFLARIVSIDPIGTGGFVIVSGGYKAYVDGLRAVDGDQSPAITLGGSEDQHFVKSDHWIVGKKPLPERGYQYVDVAAAVTTPSAATKNEGQFMSTKNGEILWTRNAWRTRPATQADITVGKHVFMLHRRDGQVYRAPKDRQEAISTSWWVAKVVDTSTMYKGSVQVAGGYTVNIDGLRVAQ